MAYRPVPRFRLLPLTIGCMSLLLFSKGFELYTGTHLLLASEARAQADAEDAPKETEKAEGADAKEEAKAEDSKEKESAEKDSGSDESKDKAKAKKEAPAEDNVVTRQASFSPVEVDLLQSLAARRDELDAREEDLKMKENLLEATEVRLERKIGEMKNMQVALKGLLEQYGKHEEGEIRSLIKIYENMKPKDAAQIFDEMEMPILLLVVDKMSERKAAPILALMTPAKAKDLTVELADQRKMRDAITQQSMAGSTPPAANP